MLILSEKSRLAGIGLMPLKQNPLKITATFLFLLPIPQLGAQKTSIWTGEAADPSWSDADNWDTSEDPNGEIPRLSMLRHQSLSMPTERSGVLSCTVKQEMKLGSRGLLN